MKPNQRGWTVKAAAVRVGRNTRTIQRWIAEGMTHREVAGMIVIDHLVLMAEHRARLLQKMDLKTRAEVEEITHTMS